MTIRADLARKRPAQVVDSTATERPLQYARPVRVSRPAVDGQGVVLMLLLLAALVAFAGLLVNLTHTL